MAREPSPLRVLYLTFKPDDYLHDLVFDGLVKTLGAENVIDHPPLDRFREQVPEGHRFNGMKFLGHDLARRDEPLEELLAGVDAVVAGCFRGDALRILPRILALRTGRPVAVLDGWDDPYVRGVIRHVDLYFKRETLVAPTVTRLRRPLRGVIHRLRRTPGWEDPLRRHVAVAREGLPKLVPLPFAAVEAPFPRWEGEPRYDVAFLGAPTSPLRVRLVEELLALRADGVRVLVPDDPRWRDDLWYEPARMPWTEYAEALSASRIAISLRGAGLDTYRYWEIPYAGALLLSEPPRTVIPENFVEGEEAVFAAAEEMPARVRELLATDTSAMAARGHAKLLARHTSVARAQTVLERLEPLVGRR